mgnify:CR=1 FL=1|tara:strand:- start:55 stop:501 length:447 start_codon:yes stop_codon:yes gene_type:complete
MGVLNTNRAQITSGGLISASFVSDLYNVLTGNQVETVVISGSTAAHTLSISGSLNVSSGITGSILGSATSASYVDTANTASHVPAANIVGTVTSASAAVSAVTASFVANTLTFQTSSLGTVINGALAVSSSGELYFGSASTWHKVTLG